MGVKCFISVLLFIPVHLFSRKLVLMLLMAAGQSWPHSLIFGSPCHSEDQCQRRGRVASKEPTISCTEGNLSIIHSIKIYVEL